MTPESPFRIPGSSAAEPQQSEARRTAEAFFAGPPATPESGVMVVTIRQRKSLETNGHADTPSVPKPPASDAHRLPKVYRVLPASSGSPQAPVPANGDGSVTTDQEPLAPAARSMAIRRRRQLHGEVTIVRPNNDAVRSLPAAVPPDADAEIWLSNHAELDWPRYPKLLAQIRLLEAEARQARQREAIEAIRWIRQAIASYGISAEDLAPR